MTLTLTPLARERVAGVLRRMVDLMEERGWWDGHASHISQARCTGQALQHLQMTPGGKVTPHIAVLTEQVIRSFTGANGIPAWNDRHTEAAPVFVKLRMMADLIEAGEAPWHYRLLMQAEALTCCCERCVSVWRDEITRIRFGLAPTPEHFCREAVVNLVPAPMVTLPDKVPSWMVEQMRVQALMEFKVPKLKELVSA